MRGVCVCVCVCPGGVDLLGVGGYPPTDTRKHPRISGCRNGHRRAREAPEPVDAPGHRGASPGPRCSHGRRSRRVRSVLVRPEPHTVSTGKGPPAFA